MRYKIQGSVKQIRMKKGCVPSKFVCLSKKRIAPIEESSDILRKRRKEIVEQVLKEEKEKELLILRLNEETDKRLSEASTSAGNNILFSLLNFYLPVKFRLSPFF